MEVWATLRLETQRVNTFDRVAMEWRSWTANLHQKRDQEGGFDFAVAR